MSVIFSYADVRPFFKNKRVLRLFVPKIFVGEEVAFHSLTYVFCSDAFLLNINQKFLQHDFYTDIITFDLRDSVTLPVTGEVYVSAERVRENANTLGADFEAELHRVIFHGALHLCGYRDKRKSEITMMRQKEDEYLRLYEVYLNSST